MLEREFTKKALEKFSKYVVSQSRANLTRKNMKNSSKLYNSIKGYVEAYRNSFSLVMLFDTFSTAIFAAFSPVIDTFNVSIFLLV